MAIKGQTLIELTDVHSGEKEEYKDENTVTNALNYVFDRCFALSLYRSISSDVTKESWKALLGGIMLFDSAIEENEDNIVAPAGVEMVGNGAYNYANSSTVTELGSWNSTESGVQSDGSIKLVWDYNTAQGNGTINCVSLTSPCGGFAGIGNYKSKSIDLRSQNYFMDNTYTSNIYNCEILKYTASRNEPPLSTYFFKRDRASGVSYYFSEYNLNFNSSYASQHIKNTGSLSIQKYNYGERKVVLNSKPTPDYETIDIDVPEELVTFFANRNSINGYVHSDGDVAYISFDFYSTSASLNEYIYILKVDSKLTSSTLIKVKNTSGGNLDLSNLSIVDNYIIAFDSSHKNIYKINISDGTDISSIEMMWDTSALSISSVNDSIIVGQCVYFVANNQFWFKIDPVKKKAVPINGYRQMSHNKMSKHSFVNDIQFSSCYSTSYNIIHIFPSYLATINNLATPVEKTASKTMKVTYTLTFD